MGPPILLVVPAKAGTQGERRLRQLIPKIAPLRIIALDQLQFPRTAPFLDALFAEDRIGHGFVKLDKHQPMYSVISNKSADSIRTMFPSAARNIACDTDVKRTNAPCWCGCKRKDVCHSCPIGRPGSPLSRGRRRLFLFIVASARMSSRKVTYVNLRNEVLGRRGRPIEDRNAG